MDQEELYHICAVAYEQIDNVMPKFAAMAEGGLAIIEESKHICSELVDILGLLYRDTCEAAELYAQGAEVFEEISRLAGQICPFLDEVALRGHGELLDDPGGAEFCYHTMEELYEQLEVVISLMQR